MSASLLAIGTPDPEDYDGALIDRAEAAADRPTPNLLARLLAERPPKETSHDDAVHHRH